MPRRRRSLVEQYRGLMAYLAPDVRVVSPRPPPALPASLTSTSIGRGKFNPNGHRSPLLRSLSKAAAAARVDLIRRLAPERFTGIGRKARTKHSVLAQATGLHRGVIARLLRGEAIGLDAAARIAQAIGRPLVLTDDLGLDDI